MAKVLTFFDVIERHDNNLVKIGIFFCKSGISLSDLLSIELSESEYLSIRDRPFDRTCLSKYIEVLKGAVSLCVNKLDTIESKSLCSYVINSGVNYGKVCGRNNCKYHNK